MITKTDIINKIHESSFFSRGSGNGSLYQELPFPEFKGKTIKSKRIFNEERLTIITENNTNLQGKIVLDIGCNIGFFTFKLAELGATCIGIDQDKEAIEIANMLKEYKNIRNVYFFNSSFNDCLIEDIKKKFGEIDIILMLSVNHWLLSEFHSIDKIIRILRPLLTFNQIIFYEPSFSKSLGGYYPETIAKENVIDFLQNIGYTKIKFLSKTKVTNFVANRNLWSGEIDIRGLAEKCLQIMKKNNTKYNNPNISSRKYLNEFLYNNEKGRAVGLINNYFVKITKRQHNRFFSYKNEAEILSHLKNVSFVPYFYFYLDIDEYRLFFYSKIDAVPLSTIKCKKKSRCFLDIEEKLFFVLNNLHEKKMIFRDLTPDNILYNVNSNQLYLVDFQWTRYETKEIQVYNPKDKEELEKSLIKIKKNGWCLPNADFTYQSDLQTAQNIIQILKIRNNEQNSFLIKILVKIKNGVKRKFNKYVSTKS